MKSFEERDYERFVYSGILLLLSLYNNNNNSVPFPPTTKR